MASNTLINFSHLEQTLQEYINAVASLYRANLVSNNHIATQDLINNIRVVLEQGNSAVEVGLNLKDYWYTVEYDMPAHWPPISEILKWVQVRHIADNARPYNGKLPTEKQLAFLIARSIAGESPNQENLKNPDGGTTGTHDLKKAVQQVNAQFEVKIADAIGEDLNTAMISILSQLNLE